MREDGATCIMTLHDASSKEDQHQGDGTHCTYRPNRFFPAVELPEPHLRVGCFGMTTLAALQLYLYKAPEASRHNQQSPDLQYYIGDSNR